MVEDLAEAFGYLYEIYDSSYYWSLRSRTYEFALKNFSLEVVEKALGEVLE